MLDLDVPNKVCNKVMAAEARKRRMGIYRLKTLFATTRPRYPKPVYGEYYKHQLMEGLHAFFFFLKFLSSQKSKITSK